MAPPVNLTQHHLINDAIQHIISWSAPFTWSQYPITNYTININNHHGEYITVVKPSDNFIYTHTSYGKNCYQLDVSLAASSQIGQGSASSIHSGHPVSKYIQRLRNYFSQLRICVSNHRTMYVLLVSDEEVLVETTAAVLSNVTVALNISVLVCTYQGKCH